MTVVLRDECARSIAGASSSNRLEMLDITMPIITYIHRKSLKQASVPRDKKIAHLVCTFWLCQLLKS